MSGRHLVARVAAVAALALGGCGGTSTPPDPPAVAAGPWCTAVPDAAWTTWLDTPAVPLSTTVSLTPWALAGDGRSFFANLSSDRFSGVVRVDATAGTYVPVHRFAHPDRYQAFGGFDGRYLVFREYHRLNDGLADFTMFAWDARTGASWQVGAARPDGRGGFFASPWRDVSVRDGSATWTVGTGDDGSGEVHVYDLAARSDRVVRRGHPAGSVLLDDGIVVWPESPAPGTRAVAQAVSVDGTAAAVPAALAGEGLIDGLATDGRAIALPGDGWKDLSWTAAPSTPVRHVVRASADDVIANSLTVSDRIVGYSVEPTAYLADATVGRAVSLPGVAYTLADTQSVLLVSRAPGNSLRAKQPVRMLRRQTMPPLPSCG